MKTTKGKKKKKKDIYWLATSGDVILTSGMDYFCCQIDF